MSSLKQGDSVPDAIQGMQMNDLKIAKGISDPINKLTFGALMLKLIEIQPLIWSFVRKVKMFREKVMSIPRSGVMNRQNGIWRE